MLLIFRHNRFVNLPHKLKHEIQKARRWEVSPKHEQFQLSSQRLALQRDLPRNDGGPRWRCHGNDEAGLFISIIFSLLWEGYSFDSEELKNKIYNVLIIAVSSIFFSKTMFQHIHFFNKTQNKNQPFYRLPYFRKKNFNLFSGNTPSGLRQQFIAAPSPVQSAASGHDLLAQAMYESGLGDIVSSGISENEQVQDEDTKDEGEEADQKEGE